MKVGIRVWKEYDVDSYRLMCEWYIDGKPLKEIDEETREKINKAIQ